MPVPLVASAGAKRLVAVKFKAVKDPWLCDFVWSTEYNTYNSFRKPLKVNSH